MYSDDKHLDNALFQTLTPLIFSSSLVFFRSAFTYLLLMFGSMLFHRMYAKFIPLVEVSQRCNSCLYWRRAFRFVHMAPYQDLQGFCIKGCLSGWAVKFSAGWKQHFRSHPDFLQEDRTTACPRTVSINPELEPNKTASTVALSEQFVKKFTSDSIAHIT